MAQKMIKRKIKKVGNGATIALHKADLDDLGVQIGSTVNVTLSTDDDKYSRTRASALKMRQRYAKTLKILGQ